VPGALLTLIDVRSFQLDGELKMKILLCSLLSLFVVSTQAHAENRWGVLAGINSANVRISDGTNSASGDSHTGLLAGVYGQFGLSEGFYFEPQLRYNGKGGGSATLSFLEIPLYAKYKIATGSQFVPVIFAGPALGYRFDATEGADAGLKSFDIAFDLGVGGEVAVNDQMNVGLSLAYSIGLLNQLETSIGDASVKNRGLNVYATASWAY
jgi:hypothetical protein